MNNIQKFVAGVFFIIAAIALHSGIEQQNAYWKSQNIFMAHAMPVLLAGIGAVFIIGGIIKKTTDH